MEVVVTRWSGEDDSFGVAIDHCRSASVSSVFDNVQPSKPGCAPDFVQIDLLSAILQPVENFICVKAWFGHFRVAQILKMPVPYGFSDIASTTRAYVVARQSE